MVLLNVFLKFFILDIMFVILLECVDLFIEVFLIIKKKFFLLCLSLLSVFCCILVNDGLFLEVFIVSGIFLFVNKLRILFLLDFDNFLLFVVRL